MENLKECKLEESKRNLNEKKSEELRRIERMHEFLECADIAADIISGEYEAEVALKILKELNGLTIKRATSILNDCIKLLQLNKVNF